MVTREDFVTRFGGVFEHSPFIAERAYDAGGAGLELTAKAVHAVLCAQFRACCGRIPILPASWRLRAS